MKVAGVLVASVAMGLGCSAQVLTHDPALAGSCAIEFARVAFVLKDAGRAFEALSGEARRFASTAELRDVVAKMHPRGYPTTVQAVEFEPVPGKPMISVFVTGHNGPEAFEYRVLVQGTAETGYRVAGFWRGSGPYPRGPLRQRLPVPLAL